GLVSLAGRSRADDHGGTAVGIHPYQAGSVERRREPVLAPGESEIDERRRAEPAHFDVRGETQAHVAAFRTRPVTLGLEILPAEVGESGLQVLLVVAGVHGEPDGRHRARELVDRKSTRL